MLLSLCNVFPSLVLTTGTRTTVASSTLAHAIQITIIQRRVFEKVILEV